MKTTQDISGDLDRLDYILLAALARDGRATHAALAEIVGLSSTAVARRQKRLEDAGLITGYRADLDLERMGVGTTVSVRIALDSQSEEALTAFERAIAKSPSVIRCHLMSGSDDYIVTVMVRSLEDFAAIHRTELSRLPRVSRVESSFALRTIVDRAVPPAVFETKRKSGGSGR